MKSELKICIICLQEKSLDAFYAHKNAKDGRNSYCKICSENKRRQWVLANKERVRRVRREYDHKNADRVRAKRQEYRELNKEKFVEYQRKFALARPERALYYEAKKRAKERGLAFDIDIDDVSIPEFCPVLGIPILILCHISKRDHSPSIDRIIPEKGYVKGNIAVISHRANRIKSDASLEELRKTAAWLESFLDTPQQPVI